MRAVKNSGEVGTYTVNSLDGKRVVIVGGSGFLGVSLALVISDAVAAADGGDRIAATTTDRGFLK